MEQNFTLHTRTSLIEFILHAQSSVIFYLQYRLWSQNQQHKCWAHKEHESFLKRWHVIMMGQSSRWRGRTAQSLPRKCTQPKTKDLSLLWIKALPFKLRKLSLISQDGRKNVDIQPSPGHGPCPSRESLLPTIMITCCVAANTDQYTAL